MKHWKALVSAVLKVLREKVDTNAKAEYQRPIGDESGSVDITISEDVDQEDAVRALKDVCKEWGCVPDSDTNSKDASFRLNIEGDFTQKQLRNK
ncbi:MAG: hypothetical protein J6D52_04420 [Clostridia bacterium]|nr:hypothetical protein [Clostridia bacterium]